MKIANDIPGACETDIVGRARCPGAEDARAPDCLDRRIEMRPIDTLKACKSNARTHSRKQIRQIANSIQRFAFINPILVDENGEVIAGHGRLEAAKLLSLAEVPTLRVGHLSAAEKKGYALADNRLAELAGWDRDNLATELQALLELNFEIEFTGFDVGEVDIILNDADGNHGENADPSGAVAAPIARPAVSRAGDLWWLGPHQLHCGNGVNADSYVAVDAAISRWQRVTGQSAMLAGVDKTFKAVAKERARIASADPARRPAATAKPEAA